MARFAVGGVYGDTVASVLETDGSIDNKTLSSAYAEIGVNKEDLLWRSHWGRVEGLEEMWG